MRYRHSLLPVILAVALSSAGAQEPQREFIVLSGGPSLVEWERYKAQPHDRWWGNFIRSARVRIEPRAVGRGLARLRWRNANRNARRVFGRRSHDSFRTLVSV